MKNLKTTYLLLLIFLAALSATSVCQPTNISWQKYSQIYGVDFFTDVIEDTNTGYTVAGARKVKSKSLEYWILRYNTNGDTIWTKTLGTENKDIPKRIAQLGDKSYILVGSSEKENTNTPFLVKIDENGSELWQKQFTIDEYLSVEDIVALDEGNCVIVGGKGSDPANTKLWMAAMNGKGEIVWEKTFMDNLNGCIKSIKKLPVGGFALTGSVAEPGKNDCDILAFRTDEEGKEEWFSWIKTPGQKAWPACICCSPDSCFMVVGWKGKCLNDINSENPVFDFDMVLNKISCHGEILWTKGFDREGSEGGNGVTIRPDGNFIVAGIKATSFLGKVGPWLLHVDADGNELDEKLLQLHFNNDQASKVINTLDGGFVVIGPGIQEEDNTRSDGWIMKFSSF
ncbi:hypothetical protein OU798_12135 [Prolixibacteraceae bacterium Z1-6]|uniref:T9SS C-terminal target domain-containing protein n=1 Tax=Draconibacterium aestuarii TaxID=2998507 RepID=A0A9X3F785_9BACT|nr:hypothetical protein [Prolixibacteraceae bacterium Z1-6]